MATVRPVAVTTLPVRLPVPLAGLAATAYHGDVYLFGGSGPQGFSDRIYRFDPRTGQFQAAGLLPQALHDAAAVPGSGGLLLCGGGMDTILPTVLRFTPGQAQAETVANLPQPLADLAAAQLGSTSYCMGGYTGTVYNRAVYAVDTGSGAAPAVAGTLPQGVRYAATAVLDGRIWLAGGQLASGQPTAAIQWFAADRTGATALLPVPLFRASGAVLGGQMLVIGGCTTLVHPLARIWGWVPPAGKPRVVGRLPQPVCWAAAATLGHTAYLFGGQGPGGATETRVIAIQLRG